MFSGEAVLVVSEQEHKCSAEQRHQASVRATPYSEVNTGTSVNRCISQPAGGSRTETPHNLHPEAFF